MGVGVRERQSQNQGTSRKAQSLAPGSFNFGSHVSCWEQLRKLRHPRGSGQEVALAQRAVEGPGLVPSLSQVVSSSVKKARRDLSEESTGSRVQLRARDPGHQHTGGEDLGVSGWQKEGSGVSAPRSLPVGGTKLVRPQSSVSGARLPARSLLGSHRTPTPPHPATGPRGGNEACVSRLWHSCFLN